MLSRATAYRSSAVLLKKKALQSTINTRFISSTPILFRQAPRTKNRKMIKNDLRKVIKTPEELLKEASNADLDKIKNDYELRKTYRYINPNQYWLGHHLFDVGENVKYNGENMEESLRNTTLKLMTKYGKMSYHTTFADIQYSELEVGDVVDLSCALDKNDLAVVAELPKTPEDPRYTLINQFGEIEFVSSFQMGLRIPRVFPKGWFNNCILKESDFLTEVPEDLEIIPIGKPRYKIEDNVERNRLFDGVMAKNASGSEVETYILPSLFSSIISHSLTKIINSAWDKLPEINLKLEVLHNVLQSNESPIQLSFYQLYKATQITDLEELAKGLTSSDPDEINKAYKDLLNKLSDKLSVDNHFDAVTLGRSVNGSVDLEGKILIDQYYAFVLGLRKNNQIFHYSVAESAPSFVTVIPLNKIVKYNKMVKFFKANPVNYDVVSTYINKKLEMVDADTNGKELQFFEKPEYYDEVIESLKLYCAASFRDDILESFLLKIIRNITPYKDIDITRTGIYELLLKLNEITNSDDPSKWWYNSLIPGSGLSSKADLEQQFYDSITPENLSSFIDMKEDIQTERQTFDDVIYCIDSVDPLEIDDGISIKQLNKDEYLISSFIADPSSYLTSDSTISKIAFERGLTLYLPNLDSAQAITMLPTAFSKEIQLGYFDKETRIIKISFVLNMKTNDIRPLENNRDIEFGTAKKFIKIDYGSVDGVLNDTFESNKVLYGISEQTKIDSKILRDDLHNLYKVSTRLSSLAKKNGRSNIFNHFNFRKEITDITQDESKKLQLTFKEVSDKSKLPENTSDLRQTKSELLVSEIMVESNHIFGEFLRRNEIPGIFKGQAKLPCSEEVEYALSHILGGAIEPSFKDLSLLQNYMTKSNLTSFPIRHESLNLSCYSTATSPLRRFSDLINHWQLHTFKSGEELMFNEENAGFMATQLKFKTELNNKISKKMTGFFTFKVLKQLQEASENEKLQFKCIVSQKPTDDGLIEVIMLDYGVKSILRTSWCALSGQKDSKEKQKQKNLLSDLEIGDLIEDAVIEDVDLLDGSIVLTSKTY